MMNLESLHTDTVPLVETQGKISVATNPLSVVGVHDSLGCGTNSDLLLQRRGATELVLVYFMVIGCVVNAYACVTQATSAAKPSM